MLDATRRLILVSAVLGLCIGLTPDQAHSQVRVRHWAFGSVGGHTGSAAQSVLVSGGSAPLGITTSANRVARLGIPANLGTGAPSGSITTASLPAGQSGIITARLSDDVGVVEATLFYDDVDAIVPVSMREVSAGNWSADVPAGALTVKGLRFYLEVQDASRTTRIPASGWANLTVQVTNHRMFTVANQYALRGVSLEPTNDDPIAVFNELGAYDPKQWRYGTYDGAAYLEPNAAEAAEPGQGFWIIAKNSTGIDVSGGSTNRAQSFQIDLHPGFNQIANPFAFPVGVGSISFPGDVEQNLIGWSGTGYQQLQSTLQPFTGYWIQNNGPAVRSITIAPQEFVPLAKEPAAPWTLAQGQAGWSYEAKASVGVFHDTDNHFGQREQASTGIDALDFHDAPPPPAGYVSLSMVRDEERLLTDFVSARDVGGTWALSLRSDQATQPFTIDFEPSGSLPATWQLVAFDEAGAQQHDVLEQPRLTGIVGESERRWILVAGPAGYVEGERERIANEYADGLRVFALRAASPNPFASAQGTTFSLALPREAPVTLKVYDLRGRFVKTLVDGTLPRGLQRVTWKGDDERGRPVAAGVYFVRMQAPETRDVRKVVVSR